MSNLPENSTDHSCPKCGNHLVARRRKLGSEAGSPFVGCSAYPRCRHTQEAGPADIAQLTASDIAPRKAPEHPPVALQQKAMATPYVSSQGRPKAQFKPPPQFNQGHRIRRKDQSNTEIVLSLVSWMPWWVNVLLAAAAFGTLHYLGLESGQALQDSGASLDAAGQASSSIASLFLPVIKWLALLFFIRAAFASAGRLKWKRKAANSGVSPKASVVRVTRRVTATDEPEPSAPDCPLCGSGMRLRTRKADGKSFYGCTHFPSCKGMVNV